ncbi:hypothetical protein D9O36_08130 [Zobellia amurskyensis]|uniref:Uncharacterized protein n=1 Tax=Zobellia amurskyensis TaxID=248905 RepID=A0A7X2ZSX9_9FLAO|nr:hypothetical protein [Zobellia amurskyensis]MUH35803.1 hypothetical protein [Zobellia amurskyensis]
MNHSKQIVKSITAFVLFCALLFPSAVQVFHFFEGHEHEVCNDSSEHYHEAPTDCSVYHIQLTSFSYDFSIFPDIIPFEYAQHNEQLFSSVVIDSYSKTNFQLRAPPIV